MDPEVVTSRASSSYIGYRFGKSVCSRVYPWVAVTAERLILADTALMIAYFALALGGRALAGLPPWLDRVATVAGHVIERGGLPLCCAGFVLLSLALLLSLPRRLRAARRALAAKG